MDKWKNVPLDDDTRIIKEQSVVIEGIQTLYQKWVFEGIIAESLIFDSKDVAGLDEKELTEFAMKSGHFKNGSDCTISTGEHGFTFVNFNFEVLS